VLQGLIRGVGLLEQAEHNLRRDAQQMSRTLEGLRAALAQVQALNEQAWTDTSWDTELSRGLATIENARMEYSQARLAWPILDGKAPAATEPGAHVSSPNLAGLGLGHLARMGLAFNWPILVLGVGVLALAVVLAVKR
jgi:hypothetical protein